ncbi:MATE family efflux transporter, partial [Singulisphaera acidiphila]
DPVAAVRAGWTAIALGAGFMTCSGLTFLLIPRWILSAFTTDPTVIATGLTLLGVAACFQLFDGLQGVTTG